MFFKHFKKHGRMSELTRFETSSLSNIADFKRFVQMVSESGGQQGPINALNFPVLCKRLRKARSVSWFSSKLADSRSCDTYHANVKAYLFGLQYSSQKVVRGAVQIVTRDKLLESKTVHYNNCKGGQVYILLIYLNDIIRLCFISSCAQALMTLISKRMAICDIWTSMCLLSRFFCLPSLPLYAVATFSRVGHLRPPGHF